MTKKSKSNVFCDITIHGLESNSTTRREANMNLALRGTRADARPENTFCRYLPNRFAISSQLSESRITP
jgi:type I restriction-modification system DNA methylase subunit